MKLDFNVLQEEQPQPPQRHNSRQLSFGLLANMVADMMMYPSTSDHTTKGNHNDNDHHDHDTTTNSNSLPLTMEDTILVDKFKVR